MLNRPRVLLFLFCCLLVGPLCFAQAVPLEQLNGRWNLILETGSRRVEMPADLRLGADGNAALVFLGAVAGEEGLYLGRLTGNQLTLKGRQERGISELMLTLSVDRLQGALLSESAKFSVTGERAKSMTPEVPARQYELLLNAVWQGVKRYYVNPQLNGIDWNGVRLRHLAAIKASRHDGEMAVAMRRMLRELGASHLDFFLAAEKPATTLKTRRVEWRELTKDIGYLALPEFSAEDLQSFDRLLDQAIFESGKYRSLIIDLRGNRGENIEAALDALNIVMRESHPIAYFATREGLARLGVSSLDQVRPESLPTAFIDEYAKIRGFRGAGMYLGGGKCRLPYPGRLVLLIDGNCTGSCEVFAAAMKDSGEATLIGRRTRGSILFSSQVHFTLTTVTPVSIFRNQVRGWRLDLPIMDIRTARGRKIEGQGIEPDVILPAEPDENADLTKVLEWLAAKRQP